MANNPLAARGVINLNDSSANQSVPRAPNPQPIPPPPPPPPPPLLKTGQAAFQGQVPPPTKQQTRPAAAVVQQNQPQRQQVPKMEQPQVRTQAQPRASAIDLGAYLQQPQMDWNLSRPLGTSDFRTDQMTEEEAKEQLSEYAIYRLERRKDDDRAGLDRGGSPWEFARKVEVKDLSKEDAAAFIRQREEEGVSVVKEQASFPFELQEQVERTHGSLNKQESEPAIFHWVLAGLYSKKQRIEKYHGARSYWGESKQLNSARRSKTGSSRGGGSRSKKDRVSVTMFFKRVPRPTVSALVLLEQRRRSAASMQKRAITAQQMQDNELAEQLHQAQQQALQRQVEAQQRFRAMEAAVQQQAQQHAQQQALQQQQQQQQQQQLFQQQLQQQALNPNQNMHRQVGGAQVHQQNMPQVHQQNVPQGAGRGAAKPGAVPPPPPPPMQARGAVPPTAPQPPKPRNAQQGHQQQKSTNKGQQTRQQVRPRAYSGSADPGSPRSSRESIGSDDESYCETADTPLSSQASDTPRSRRGRARSRSRSRSPCRSHCHGHGHCKSHTEEPAYGFEPVKRLSRHDQHYILENQVPARGTVRLREVASPEPLVSLQQLESIKREVYSAAMRDMHRAREDRPVEEVIFRQRTAMPAQRQHSVRVVTPARVLEDEFDFQRLRLDEDKYEFERRRMDDGRWPEAEYASERRRCEGAEGSYFYPESPRREERGGDGYDYTRTRDWASGEYDTGNPFRPFDGSRRGSYGGGRGR